MITARPASRTPARSPRSTPRTPRLAPAASRVPGGHAASQQHTNVARSADWRHESHVGMLEHEPGCVCCAGAAPTPGAPTPGAPTPGAPTPGAPTPGAPTLRDARRRRPPGLHNAHARPRRSRRSRGEPRVVGQRGGVRPPGTRRLRRKRARERRSRRPRRSREGGTRRRWRRRECPWRHGRSRRERRARRPGRTSERKRPRLFPGARLSFFVEEAEVAARAEVGRLRQAPPRPGPRVQTAVPAGVVAAAVAAGAVARARVVGGVVPSSVLFEQKKFSVRVLGKRLREGRAGAPPPTRPRLSGSNEGFSIRTATRVDATLERRRGVRSRRCGRRAKRVPARIDTQRGADGAPKRREGKGSSRLDPALRRRPRRRRSPPEGRRLDPGPAGSEKAEKAEKAEGGTRRRGGGSENGGGRGGGGRGGKAEKAVTKPARAAGPEERRSRRRWPRRSRWRRGSGGAGGGRGRGGGGGIFSPRRVLGRFGRERVRRAARLPVVVVRRRRHGGRGRERRHRRASRRGRDPGKGRRRCLLLVSGDVRPALPRVFVVVVGARGRSRGRPRGLGRARRGLPPLDRTHAARKSSQQSPACSQLGSQQHSTTEASLEVNQHASHAPARDPASALSARQSARFARRPTRRGKPAPRGGRS